MLVQILRRLLLLVLIAGPLCAQTKVNQDNVALGNLIYVDGVKYSGAQALQSAIQACSAKVTACIVDGRDPTIGTQTFTANPFSGLNMPITVQTGGYTGSSGTMLHLSLTTRLI